MSGQRASFARAAVNSFLARLAVQLGEQRLLRQGGALCFSIAL
jgi:hypothetical protein